LQEAELRNETPAAVGSWIADVLRKRLAQMIDTGSDVDEYVLAPDDVTPPPRAPHQWHDRTAGARCAFGKFHRRRAAGPSAGTRDQVLPVVVELEESSMAHQSPSAGEDEQLM
jgi:hypothetical protein